jgi:hypothetical protein
MVRVRPGRDEVFANGLDAGAFSRAFSSDDLPTLDRPKKASSGIAGVDEGEGMGMGMLANLLADQRNVVGLEVKKRSALRSCSDVGWWRLLVGW